MKVLIIDSIHSALQELLESHGHECMDLSKAPVSDVHLALPFAEILVMRSRISIDAQVIDSCPNLSVIARAGAGLEHIDVTYAESKGIKVLSSPEGNRQAVAEHALGMLLALFNRLAIVDREIRNGIWQRKPNSGIELQGMTVGIIGYGNTGSAFAQVLSGFGVNILAYDKYKTGHDFQATMEEVFEKSQVVSLHLPLTDETKGLVSTEWISQFAQPVYVINTSRGAIVKTLDLLEAIEQSIVFGACLDVLEYETEQLQMPSIEQLPPTAEALFRNDKVLLSPHTAGLSDKSYQKLSSILAEKILSTF